LHNILIEVIKKSLKRAIYPLDRFLEETAMARLPNETVTRIKREVSLVRLAEARGFELKPHGKHYAIHCPACGAKGSPIDWVMKLEGVSIKKLKEVHTLTHPARANRTRPVDWDEDPESEESAAEESLMEVLEADYLDDPE
jgi:hypothetical protein